MPAEGWISSGANGTPSSTGGDRRLGKGSRDGQRMQLAVWLLTQGGSAVRQLVEVNKATAGREKIYRVAQYFSRYLIWYLKRHGSLPTSEAVVRLSALESQLSNGRKLMRLFKSIDHTLDTWNSFHKPGPLWLRLLRASNDANRGLRMVFDHIQWAGTIGLLGPGGKAAAARLGEIANLFWLLGILCSIGINAHGILSLEGDDRPESAKKRQALQIDLVRELFDLPIPAFGIHLTPGFVETGHVGLSGTVSSLIGLYQVWTSVTAKMPGRSLNGAAAVNGGGHDASKSA